MANTPLPSKEVPDLRTSYDQLVTVLGRKGVSKVAAELKNDAKILMEAVEYSYKGNELPFRAVAPLMVAKQVFDSAYKAINDAIESSKRVSVKDYVRKEWKRFLGSGTVGSKDKDEKMLLLPEDIKYEVMIYTRATKALIKILRIEPPACGLIDNPDIELRKHDGLNLNYVSKWEAVLDGAKTVFDLAANISESCLTPLKAACQTILKIVEEYEAFKDLESQLAGFKTLLTKSEHHILDLYNQNAEEKSDLNAQNKARKALRKAFAPFLRELQRITIRLAVLMPEKKDDGRTQRSIMKFVAVNRFKAIIDDEKQAFLVSNQHLLIALGSQAVMLMATGFYSLGVSLEQLGTFTKKNTTSIQELHTSLEWVGDRLEQMGRGVQRNTALATLTLACVVAGLVVFIFGIFWLHGSDKAIQAAVQKVSVELHGVQRDQQVLLTKQEESLKIMKLSWLVDQSNVLRSAAAPPIPVVYGRTDVLNALVHDTVTGSSVRLAILGEPGIGKTTLAQAVFYDSHVIRHYPSRYFLQCDGESDVIRLVKDLAISLQLDRAHHQLHYVLAELKAGPPSIIMIDNLETLWRSADRKVHAETRRFLDGLSALDHVALIVTLRGRFAPPGFVGTFVDTLSPAAAREVFFHIAGSYDHDASESSAVNTLLGEVDNLPLAVTLLARLAKTGISPSLLLKRWHRSGTNLLEIDPDSGDRLESVNRSINISLAFLPPANPEPLQVLVICSRLPRGVRPRLVDGMSATFKDIEKAVDILVNVHALIHRTATGELRMLGTIRDYVVRSQTLPPAHRTALLKVFSAIQHETWTDDRPVDAATRLDQMLPELANFEGLLLDLANSGDEIPDEVVGIVFLFARLSQFSRVSCGVAYAYVNRASTNPELQWRGMNFVACAQCYAYQHNVPRVMECTQRLLALDDYPGRWNDIVTLHLLHAKLYYDLGDLDKALDQAWSAYQSISFPVALADELRAAEIIHMLGLVLLRRNDLPRASRAFSISVNVRFKRHQWVAGGESLRYSADVAARQGHFEAAESKYQRALVLMEHSTDPNLQSDARLGYATFLHKSRELDAAADLIEQSLAVLRHFYQIYGTARLTYSLAIVRLTQWRFTEAAELLQEALALSKENGYIDLEEKSSKYFTLLNEYAPLVTAPSCRLEQKQETTSQCYFWDMRDIGGLQLQRWIPLVDERLGAMTLD